MKKLFTILFTLVLAIATNAQDGHFSQFYNAPLFYNPAGAGMNHNALRIGNNYRTQWNPIQPYSTIDLYLDKRQGNWGIGGMWSKNGAGKASINTNNMLLNVAHHIGLSETGQLSLGFQGGLYQRSANPNDLVFENQYNFESHEVVSESGENLSTTKTSLFDMNVGLAYTHTMRSMDLVLGAAGSHLFQGNESFYEGSTSTMPRKITLHGQLDIRLDSTMSLSPFLVFQRQGQAQTTNITLMFKRQMNEGKNIQAGIGSRLKDAYIFYIGMGLNQLNIGLSYDINSSTLTRGTGGYGAFEFSISFLIQQRTFKSTAKTGAVKDGQLFQSKPSVNPRMTDTDGDGVADESDHCPYEPGSAKNRGCPGKIDSDGDGLTDDVDLCPFMYGLPLQSGCPDTDGDGVADIDDECPTIYGAINLMGCPDSDRDGVSDKEDLCPTLFGLVQNHGCPDGRAVISSGPIGYYQYNNGLIAPNLNVPMQIYYPPVIPNPSMAQPGMAYPQWYPNIDQGTGYSRSYPLNTTQHDYSQSIVLDNFYVTFNKDSEELTYEARKQLRDYVVALGLNEEYKLLISGHTDADGSLDYNVDLGQRRADSVRNYLLQFGVGPDRVISISYGEQQPVSPNTTIDGMARNRRVEVMLIR